MVCPSCASTIPDGSRFCPSCGHTLGVLPNEERRIVTVLFADLVGFTTLAEYMDPEQAKRLVDRAFARLVDDVTEYGGRVDKLLGDGILALFGAPVSHEDDPERAVRAGLRMQETLNRTMAQRPPTASIDIRMRVGINTGEVLVGTLAGTEYTAMGDVVNTASRLQSMAPPGPGDRRRGDARAHRPHDRLRVRRRGARPRPRAPDQGVAGRRRHRPARRAPPAPAGGADGRAGDRAGHRPGRARAGDRARARRGAVVHRRERRGQAATGHRGARPPGRVRDARGQPAARALHRLRAGQPVLADRPGAGRTLRRRPEPLPRRAARRERPARRGDVAARRSCRDPADHGRVHPHPRAPLADRPPRPGKCRARRSTGPSPRRSSG